MNTLVNAFAEYDNNTLTLNGMEIKKSSMNSVVDLFYAFGSNRNDSANVGVKFQKACMENVDLAVRVALYGRDVRGGMGERQVFRDILTDFARQHPAEAIQLVPFVSEVGRFDDLFALIGTPAEEAALEHYADALRNGNALAAKWAPREKSARSAWAKKLRNHLGLNARDYRKLLAGMSNVVEQKMCANDWDEITYDHVPSLASIRYQKAFERHDPEGYNEYKAALESGEAKINAGAVYPYQVVRSIRQGDARIAEQQWKALPNWIPEGKSFLPLVDVSASMNVSVGDANTSAMDISVALGLYCALKGKGPFEGKMLTFTDNPSWVDVAGLSLKNAVDKTYRAEWGGSTNIEAAYRQILNLAVRNNVPQEDMPDYLIVFSDMQFNAMRFGPNNFMDNARNAFERAGYSFPNLVFWNLYDYNSNTPVEFDEDGTALVSGFSPSLMKSIMSDQLESFTPLNVMLDAVMNDRYNWRQS